MRVPAPKRRVGGRRSFLTLSVLALSTACASAAWAVDFRLCNATSSRVGVAIGYKDGETWITEGWWNVGGSSCETLLKGPLVARYYYVYALDYDHGGEWGGGAFMCTKDKEFTIKGIDNCLTRGYSRTGFFEIDTGEQRSWTVQLTEGSTNEQTQVQARPDAAMADRSVPTTGTTR
ncbi:DUF1036 domain-containing protein [Flaviflagellibacter deserti]|jgi:uncharacterized membrane protein|uniref:DUF1036 domain-containing protein n=1 Tax=Flaviflagellibacter deserti TaxID=2267266 RepID=A0ABV9YVS8_9HYPH